MFFFCMLPAIQNEIGADIAPLVDEALLPRIAEGDRDAFAAFYAQTDRAVFGFALSILKNRQDAEDIMQDTYIRVLDAAASYQPRGKPMAWVLAITRNLARMRLRSLNRSQPAEPEELEAISPLLDGEALATDDRLTLQTALAVLGEEERQIVILHAVSGMKHREIAQLLELPLPTTLSKYARALAKLKKILNGGSQP